MGTKLASLCLLLVGLLTIAVQVPGQLPSHRAGIGVATPISTIAMPSPDNSQDRRYVKHAVNARECPSTECLIIVQIAEGQEIETLGIVEGESVEQTNIWYVSRLGQQTVYIHSAYLLDSRPSSGAQSILDLFTRSEGILTTLSILFITVVGVLPLFTRILRGFGERKLSSLLFLGLVVCGIVVSFVAFVVGQMSGLGVLAFWQGALINLGTGILGAAITFIIFDNIWNKATDRSDKFAKQETLETMRKEISALTAAVAQLDRDRNARTQQNKSTSEFSWTSLKKMLLGTLSRKRR